MNQKHKEELQILIHMIKVEKSLYKKNKLRKALIRCVYQDDDNKVKRMAIIKKNDYDNKVE